jgi:hypothetical protein
MWLPVEKETVIPIFETKNIECQFAVPYIPNFLNGELKLVA